MLERGYTDREGTDTAKRARGGNPETTRPVVPHAPLSMKVRSMQQKEGCARWHEMVPSPPHGPPCYHHRGWG